MVACIIEWIVEGAEVGFCHHLASHNGADGDEEADAADDCDDVVSELGIWGQRTRRLVEC